MPGANYVNGCSTHQQPELTTGKSHPSTICAEYANSDFNTKIEYSSHLENGQCQKRPTKDVSEAPLSPTVAAAALPKAAPYNEGPAEAIAQAMLGEATGDTGVVWRGLSCDRCDLMLGSRFKLFQVCIMRQYCLTRTKTIKAHRRPYARPRDLLWLPFQLPQHF